MLIHQENLNQNMLNKKTSCGAALATGKNMSPSPPNLPRAQTSEANIFWGPPWAWVCISMGMGMGTPCMG